MKFSVVRAAFAAVCVSVLSLGAASPAFAHDSIVASTPAADELLTTLPEVFSVTASEPVRDLAGDGAGFGLLAKDAEGNFYGDGCVVIDGDTVTSAASLGAAGTYSLVWQIVSSDGHTASGEIPFEWAPTGEFTPSEGSATAPTCGGAVVVPGDDAHEEGEAPVATQSPVEPWLVWLLAGVVAVVLTILVVAKTRRR